MLDDVPRYTRWASRIDNRMILFFRFNGDKLKRVSSEWFWSDLGDHICSASSSTANSGLLSASLSQRRYHFVGGSLRLDPSVCPSPNTLLLSPSGEVASMGDRYFGPLDNAVPSPSLGCHAPIGVLCPLLRLVPPDLDGPDSLASCSGPSKKGFLVSAWCSRPSTFAWLDSTLLPLLRAPRDRARRRSCS